MNDKKIFSPQSPFQKFSYEASFYDDMAEEESPNVAEYIEVFPKSIVNENNSKYLPFKYSLNPYQGCEHGCSYCYARPTHEYWSMNAGEDFERKILFKRNAAALLELFFKKKNYEPSPILISGNTDCYQPIERKLKITRSILEKCLAFQHPVSILTKNALVTRDLDILTALHTNHLIAVTITLNSLTETLRRKMEPRTSSINNKLKAIETLIAHEIPTNIMIGAVIPGLNCHEILPIIEKTAQMGVRNVVYSLINLNDNVAPYFINWIEKNFPLKAEKVLNAIKAIRNGALESKDFKEKISGVGSSAAYVHSLVKIGRKKFLKEDREIFLNCQSFQIPNKGKQLKMF